MLKTHRYRLIYLGLFIISAVFAFISLLNDVPETRFNFMHLAYISVVYAVTFGGKVRDEQLKEQNDQR